MESIVFDCPIDGCGLPDFPCINECGSLSEEAGHAALAWAVLEWLLDVRSVLRPLITRELAAATRPRAPLLAREGNTLGVARRGSVQLSDAPALNRAEQGRRTVSAENMVSCPVLDFNGAAMK
jgi:hypothetical protein